MRLLGDTECLAESAAVMHTIFDLLFHALVADSVMRVAMLPMNMTTESSVLFPLPSAG